MPHEKKAIPKEDIKTILSHDFPMAGFMALITAVFGISVWLGNKIGPIWVLYGDLVLLVVVLVVIFRSKRS